jgi:hypothetical protein
MKFIDFSGEATFSKSTTVRFWEKESGKWNWDPASCPGRSGSEGADYMAGVSSTLADWEL